MDALTDGTLATARRVIEDEVMGRFSPGVVAWVAVRPWVFEDEEDLRVEVVLVRPFSEAERAKSWGLTTKLRDKLAEVGEQRFPVVDFMTKSEALKMRREAARPY